MGSSWGAVLLVHPCTSKKHSVQGRVVGLPTEGVWSRVVQFGVLQMVLTCRELVGLARAAQFTHGVLMCEQIELRMSSLMQPNLLKLLSNVGDPDHFAGFWPPFDVSALILSFLGGRVAADRGRSTSWFVRNVVRCVRHILQILRARDAQPHWRELLDRSLPVCRVEEMLQDLLQPPATLEATFLHAAVRDHMPALLAFVRSFLLFRSHMESVGGGEDTGTHLEAAQRRIFVLDTQWSETARATSVLIGVGEHFCPGDVRKYETRVPPVLNVAHVDHMMPLLGMREVVGARMARLRARCLHLFDLHAEEFRLQSLLDSSDDVQLKLFFEELEDQAYDDMCLGIIARALSGTSGSRNVLRASLHTQFQDLHAYLDSVFTGHAHSAVLWEGLSCMFLRDLDLKCNPVRCMAVWDMKDLEQNMPGWTRAWLRYLTQHFSCVDFHLLLTGTQDTSASYTESSWSNLDVVSRSCSVSEPPLLDQDVPLPVAPEALFFLEPEHWAPYDLTQQHCTVL